MYIGYRGVGAGAAQHTPGPRTQQARITKKQCITRLAGGIRGLKSLRDEAAKKMHLVLPYFLFYDDLKHKVIPFRSKSPL